MSEIQTVEGQNFTKAELGDFEKLDQYVFQGGFTAKGKVFLKDLLHLTGMEVSLNKMPAGEGVPFLHKHKNNEELYIVVKGKGQFQIDGEIIDVQEGSVVRIAPDGARSWRSTASEDIYVIVVQAGTDTLKTWTGADGLPVNKPVQWEK